MTQSKDPLPSLDALQKKIDKNKPEGDKDSPDAAAAETGKAMNLATELMAGVGVGGVIGYFVDRAFETSPIFFILFFFLGFAAGIRNLMRRFNKGD